MAGTLASTPRAAGPKSPAWLLVLAATASVQFGAAVAATIFDDVGAAGASLLRLVFAAVVLGVAWRPDPRAFTGAQLRIAAGYGLALGTMNLCFYEALDRLPLGVAVTIEFAGPLGVAVAGSRRAADLAFTALAAAGIVLLAVGGGSDGGSIEPLGLVFVLGAAASWAAYIHLAQAAGRVFCGGRGLALASVVAVALPLGPGLAEGGAALVHPVTLLAGLAVALMSSVIPYSLEVEALRRMPANVFGVLMALEPVVAALAGLLVLGQSLGVASIVAIGCVVVATVGVMRGAGRRPPSATSPPSS